jgi:hypothetical protein
MNFLQLGFKGKNEWWKYALMVIILVIGTVIGQIPIAFAALSAVGGDLDKFQKSGESNFADAGIDSNLYLFLMLLGFIVAFALFFVALKGMHKKKLKWVITSRETVDWKRIFFGVIVWGIIVVASMSLDLVINPESYQWNFQPTQFFILCIVAITCIPLQTTLEEVLFRGYYMQGLAVSATKRGFPALVISILLFLGLYLFAHLNLELSGDQKLLWIFGSMILIIVFHFGNIFKKFSESTTGSALYRGFRRNFVPMLITSMIFGLLHGANPEIEKLGYGLLFFYVASGFFFGIVTLLDDGAEIAIGMHAINNIIAALFITANWTVFQTDALYIDTSEPTINFEMFLPVFILYPLAIFIFSKKYKWKNWNEKLFGQITDPYAQDSIDELGA